MVFARDRGRPPRQREEDTGGMQERVVYTRRIAKVVKGGRRLRFNALVVVGDGQGQVGAGLGKALVIPDAVRKGNAIGRRNMVNVPLKGSTIPHQITVKKGATIIVLKPAREGTGNNCGRRDEGDAGTGRSKGCGGQVPRVPEPDQHRLRHSGCPSTTEGPGGRSGPPCQPHEPDRLISGANKHG